MSSYVQMSWHMKGSWYPLADNTHVTENICLRIHFMKLGWWSVIWNTLIEDYILAIELMIEFKKPSGLTKSVIGTWQSIRSCPLMQLLVTTYDVNAGHVLSLSNLVKVECIWWKRLLISIGFCLPCYLSCLRGLNIPCWVACSQISFWALITARYIILKFIWFTGEMWLEVLFLCEDLDASSSFVATRIIVRIILFSILGGGLGRYGNLLHSHWIFNPFLIAVFAAAFRDWR